MPYDLDSIAIYPATIIPKTYTVGSNVGSAQRSQSAITSFITTKSPPPIGRRWQAN
jgi:hypothetical protein